MSSIMHLSRRLKTSEVIVRGNKALFIKQCATALRDIDGKSNKGAKRIAIQVVGILSVITLIYPPTFWFRRRRLKRRYVRYLTSMFISKKLSQNQIAGSTTIGA